MRLKNTRWMGLVVAGGLAALQTLAQAQEKKDEKPAPPPAAPTVTPNPPVNPEAMRARQIENQLTGMSKVYGLTDEQKPKVKSILEEQFKQMDEMRKDTALAPEDRRKKLMDIRNGSQAKIKALLTPEQVQKMESMRQRAPRPPGATPGAPPAAPANPSAPAKPAN